MPQTPFFVQATAAANPLEIRAISCRRALETSFQDAQEAVLERAQEEIEARATGR
jgi:hypothetical protein